MADDKKNGDDGAKEPEETEGLIEAEGPDVETGGSPEPVEGFTDDDLAFLAGEKITEEVDPAVEILGDLKRVQAEFANYSKRVERDREANRELNIAEVVKSLLPVLDDLALAETHGDLTEGPMAVIAQKLRSSLDKFERFLAQAQQ